MINGVPIPVFPEGVTTHGVVGLLGYKQISGTAIMFNVTGGHAVALHVSVTDLSGHSFVLIAVTVIVAASSSIKPVTLYVLVD